MGRPRGRAAAARAVAGAAALLAALAAAAVPAAGTDAGGDPDAPGAGFRFRPWSERVLSRMVSTAGRSAHDMLHSRHAVHHPGAPDGVERVPFVAPLEVDVVLVGLNGDGENAHAMDAGKLERLLNATLPYRRPAKLTGGARGARGAELLGAKLEIQWRVTHADARRLRDVSRELSSNMVFAGDEAVLAVSKDDANVEGTVNVPVFNVEASKSVQGALSNLYKETVGKSGRAALIVLSPNKHVLDPRTKEQKASERVATMRPVVDEGGYMYRYRYGGGGLTAAWVSEGEYAVVDLSAGPCALGRAGQDEDGVGGAVGPLTLPRVADYHEDEMRYGSGMPQEAADAQLRGRVADVARSAVQHLFAPDVVEAPHTTMAAERVLVPLVVFVDHESFDPLAKRSSASMGTYIDVEKLEHELRALALPGQKIVVVPTLQSMADHPAIAMALASATAAGGADTTGAHVTRRRPRVHGARLLEELRSARDVLTQGLRQADTATSEGSQGNARKAAAFLSEAGDVGSAFSGGTHVLPVYLFSCTGLPRGTAMDGESLVASAPDGVAVLQTAEEALPLAFVSQGRTVTVDARRAMGPIVAGVARALAGAADPHERWSSAHEERKEAWMWAAGAHPFGAFAPAAFHSVSKALVGAAQRGAALARADTAAAKVATALAHIEGFVDEHLRDPMGGRVTPAALDGADRDGDVGSRLPSAIDALYHDPSRPDPPLPHATLAAVERDLDSLEERFVTLAETLWSGDLGQAHRVSASLLTAAISFERYAIDELDAARSQFMCCELRRARPAAFGGHGVALGAIAAAVLLAAYALLRK